MRLSTHSLNIGNISINHCHLECLFFYRHCTARARSSSFKSASVFGAALWLCAAPPPFTHHLFLLPLPFLTLLLSIGRSAERTTGAVRWRLRKVARIRDEDQPVPATPELTQTPRPHPPAHVSPKSSVRDTCRPVLDRFGWRITMVGDQRRADWGLSTWLWVCGYFSFPSHNL